MQIPDEVAGHKWHTKAVVAGHVVPATQASCGPRGGTLNKDRANEREHVAVDLDRPRRSEHGSTRDGDDLDEQERSDRRVTMTVRLADLSPWQRLTYAPLLAMTA